jgi:hypothetical protein
MPIGNDNVNEIIRNIRTLHQTTADQRPCGLTSYLADLFGSLDNVDDVSAMFSQLTDLLRTYDDRAALKVEFLQAQCLETIDRLLKLLVDDREQIVVVLLRFTGELIVNSENVQQKFLDYNGYEKIFGSLRHVRSPTIEFVNQLLILMIDKGTLNIDSSLTSVDLFVHFVNPHMANVVIHWLPHINIVNHQHHIIHTMNIILARSIQNKMLACSHGIILSLFDILDREHCSTPVDDRIVLDTVFSILEKLTRFSMSQIEIRRICQLFLQKTSFHSQLLRVLITAAKHDDPDTQMISSYFDLQRSNSVSNHVNQWSIIVTLAFPRALFCHWCVVGHRYRFISLFIVG